MLKYVDIKDISPAIYNPRKINEKEFEILKESLSKLGLIIPILVNRDNNTIVAGHQRTKAAKSIGIKRVPVFYINNLYFGDEIKFNQMHNAIDDYQSVKSIIKDDSYDVGFNKVDNKCFDVISSNAPRVKEICKLLLRYGNVLSAISANGDIVIGTDYIKACQLLSLDVNIYITPDSKVDYVNKYITQDYGQYYYENIKRETFVQGLAQLERKTERIKGKKSQSSTLYENLVIPYIKNKEVSILDFGCGKGGYIKMLSKKYDAIGLEFYNNNKKSINISNGHRMINSLIDHVNNKGMFDVVVCDSVLNSVDSIQAEINVLRCLNIFSKGKVFLSGRPIDGVLNKYNMKRDKNIGKRFLEFLDGDNFSANFREGKWYFQHYHSKEQIIGLLDKCGLQPINMHWQEYGDSFQIECDKIKKLQPKEVKEAINFEFNLPLPNNKRYNRHKEMLGVVRDYYNIKE